MIATFRPKLLPLSPWGVLAIAVAGCASQGKTQPDDDTDEGGPAASMPDAGAGVAARADGGSTVSPPGSGPEATAASGQDAGAAAGGPGDASPSAEAGASAWTCPAGPFGAPIPSGATPARIAGVPPSDAFNNTNNNFGIIEGPVWIGDALYVSEIGTASASPDGGPPPPNPPSRILKLTLDGTVTVAFADSGSNGLAVDKDGNLYGAVHKDGSITRFDLTTGIATPVVTTYMGNRFDSPNDLSIRSDGNIYFSDPDYQAAPTRPQPMTGLYRGVPGSTVGQLIDATLSEPNGVTLSLDENTMYVASTGGIYKYPVMTDGSVGAGAVFAQSVNGDGMAIDCGGNLYVAEVNTSTVVVLSPSGTQIGDLSVPSGSVQSVSNVAFGGSDHKTLYITALGSGMQKGVFQVALSIPGMPY